MATSRQVQNDTLLNLQQRAKGERVGMNMLIYHRPRTTSVITATNLPSVFPETDQRGLFSLPDPPFHPFLFFPLPLAGMTMAGAEAACPPPELSCVLSVYRETMVG